MKTVIAFDKEEAVKHSFQSPFPTVTECVHCKGEARLGFVAHEEYNKGLPYVSEVYNKNVDSDGLWLHDACAVAVYFCKKCLEPTALANQA